MGTVAIWWGRIAGPDRPDQPVLPAWLDPVEQRRRARYQMPADQQRFALGVVITRAVLGSRLGIDPADVPLDRRCEHCAGDHGPPRLVGGGVELSVTHSGDVVAVAFAAEPVGLDVEVVDLDPSRHLGTATHALAPAELEQWRRLPPEAQPRAFYAIWSRKEAVLKASRSGLTLPLAGLVVGWTGGEPSVRSWSAQPELVSRLWLTDLDHWPGYAAALATIDNPRPEVQLHAWSAAAADPRPSGG